LAVRLENIILELEGEKKHVLIVAEASVVKCLYAFFADVYEKVKHSLLKEIPFLAVTPRVLIQIVPKAYGLLESSYLLGQVVQVISENHFNRYKRDY
jgi:6-phosphofructo-2-kinase/fructose-2,6-biphosphatase 4